ncbi:hypothetical protein BCR35DRAFT_354690 [Leucosporidium creatinivorum]|uniref:Fe2OG dioxygenase domain-containing protein n=1 Tax=Leucosporidium creatinivorum TaxID=106004 RepID=A0A1Y2EC40_9BASI|nr:hypothetical protein BCR35DRAFT_354690 [Leucosporidium creatinivorum]
MAASRLLPPGKVDFAAAGFPDYSDCFAMILDSLFTPAELASFLAAAESSSPWEPARVNATADESYLMPDYRNGERIILDDAELSARIFERIRPHLKELEETSWGRDSLWRMVGMNERLRFLRYPVGGFFRPHYDGAYYRDESDQRTFLTIQLYLPSSSDGSPESMQASKGGATRFFFGRSVADYMDVEPIPGRVLIFQHSSLKHSGEEVEEGVKCTMRSDVLFEPVCRE